MNNRFANVFKNVIRPLGLLIANSSVGPLFKIISESDDKDLVPEELFNLDTTNLTEDARNLFEEFLKHYVKRAHMIPSYKNWSSIKFVAGHYFRQKALEKLASIEKPKGFPTDFTSNTVPLQSAFSAIREGCKDNKCNALLAATDDYVYACDILLDIKNSVKGVPADYRFPST